MNFPRFVYKNGGKYQRKGGMYSFVSVNSDAELNDHLSNGWVMSLDDVINNIQPKKDEVVKSQVPDDNAPVTREELNQKAKELGIKVHHKMKDSTIELMINDALSKQGQ